MPTRRDHPIPPEDSSIILRPLDHLFLGSMAVVLGQLEGADHVVLDLLADEQAPPMVLAAMAHLHTDPDQRAVLTDEVQRRALQLPDWFARLGSTTVATVVEMVGPTLVDNLAIELRLPDGQPVTCLIRIDHERGTIVSDAELLAAELSTVTRAVTVAGETERPRWRHLRSADARARLEFALSVPRRPLGVRPTEGVEPYRPLLGWITRLLPAGGEGYPDDLLDLFREMAREHRLHQRFGMFDLGCCEQLDLQEGHGMRASLHGSQLLHELTALAGGGAQLDALDDTPLPEEPFDWTGVPDDIRTTVHEVLELCDRACGQFFDAEIRTATRRLLHRLATVGAAAFRRKRSVHTAAAALVWVVARRNHLIGTYDVRAKDLNESLAVGGSSSSRASGLLRAAGLEQSGDGPEFSAEFLTGRRRAQLIALRDRLAHVPVYRLRIELDGVAPPITRTIEVLGDMPLQHVHDAIQVAFGWEGTRPARFELGDLTIVSIKSIGRCGRSVSTFDVHLDGEDFEDDGWDVDVREPAHRDEHSLQGVAGVGDSFTYRYGDWGHRVTVEAVEPLTQTPHGLPHLVQASRATPPDVIGGPSGYQRLLDSMLDGREDLAAELANGIVTPVLAGSFDPWRPDPEQAEAGAIAHAMSVLAT